MRPRLRAFFSRGSAPLEFAGLVLVAMMLVNTHADADLWGHTRFGADIVAAGRLPPTDRYSFTSDRPWVNHEWLSEVAISTAYAGGGPAGLVLLKLALLAAMLLVAAASLRAAGVPRAWRPVLLAQLVLGILPRAVFVRPQLFSLVLFAVLLALLTAIDAGRRELLALVPFAFLAWVNLHGGWIVGAGTLALWTAVRALQARSPRRAAPMVAAAVVAGAATLANPYGSTMWEFLWATVGLGRADIAEWQPITHVAIGETIPWMVVAAAAAVLVWRSAPRRDWFGVGVTAVLAAGSFKVARLDAFFAVATVMLLAPRATFVSARSTVARRHAAAPDPRFAFVTAIAAVVMVVPGASTVRQQVGCVHIDGAWAPDREAAAFIAANHLRGRLVTPFDWGEYAIWHFGPALQVSMDGRRETVYSDRAVAANRDFYAGREAALSYPDRNGADYIWVPTGAPVSTQLVRRGWQTIYRGSRSMVLASSAAQAGYLRPPPLAGQPCFPGP